MAASAAGGEPEYELQSVNFHSGFFGENGTLKTFEVPHNITLINIGTFGAYTCDPQGGNISQKTASGIDHGSSSGNPNTPLDKWIVEHFSVRDPRFGDLCILLPGTTALDRYMAHDKNALIKGTPESKSMVYRTRQSLKGYYSFSQIHDAVNIERIQGAPATRMQNTPDAFPEFGSGIPFSRSSKTLDLSDLCKWISENANGKNIILFVLGCQVVPNDISLSTIRTIDESKRIKNVQILENFLVGLSLGRQVVHELKKKTSTIKTRSEGQTETQEALEDADEGEGGAVYAALRPEYAASEWKYPPDLWKHLFSAASLSPRLRLEEGEAAFNQKINSGVYLTEAGVPKAVGEKIADVIIKVSREGKQRAVEAMDVSAGLGGGKRKRRRKTRKKKTKKNRKRNHKTKKRKRKRNKRTRRNNSTMKLRN